MVLPEEKKIFLEHMAKMTGNKMNSLEVQLKLHEFLLKDTNDGKLYKYRMFDDKGYALKNFQEGTLYCSKADTFNDPFDCKIGITFQSLCEAIYGDEMKMLLVFLEKFLGIIKGELLIEECNSDERRVVEKLLMNENLTELIENKNKLKKQEAEAWLLKKMPIVIVELMQIILSDIVFESSLGACVNILPSIMKGIDIDNMLLLGDNDSNFKDYARVKGIADDTDEVGFMLRLSKELYPDNNKLTDNMEKFIDDIENILTHKIKNLFCVGCLCTGYKNRLMWSHYAEHHKGFCIEYDFNSVEREVLSQLPFPVFYSESRPIIPWKVALENTTKNMDEAYTQLMLGVLTKDKIWEYENEWRILLEGEESAELTMPKVSCVYLGAAIETDNRAKIIEIAKKNKIPVKQMIIDRGVYDLHAEDVII